MRSVAAWVIPKMLLDTKELSVFIDLSIGLSRKAIHQGLICKSQKQRTMLKTPSCLSPRKKFEVNPSKNNQMFSVFGDINSVILEPRGSARTNDLIYKHICYTE